MLSSLPSAGVTAYELRDAQGGVVRLNIFSLPEVSLPALRIADSVRLRSVCVNRDSKGELSLVGRVGPSAVGGSIQLLLAEVLRVGAFPWLISKP